jgi:hypothetical protein
LESTEFHDDDDPLYSIKEFATFANQTENTAIEMDPEKTFLENFEDQNYHEIFYRSAHSNEFGFKPYVLYKYSDLRDLFLIYKYDEQIDIEQLID